jgi:hypothetical protein
MQYFLPTLQYLCWHFEDIEIEEQIMQTAQCVADIAGKPVPFYEGKDLALSHPSQASQYII